MMAFGSAGLQSIMPGLGRSLHVPDVLIGVAFIFSAGLYSAAAPYWARRVPRYGSKPMIVIGLIGFVVAMVLAGIALVFGLLQIVGGMLAFSAFIGARMIYGGVAAAAMPAAQAMVAAGTSREERSVALTMLASAFGLGSILGPALAPFFIMPLIGLAGPPFMFALLGLIVLVAVIFCLPRQLGRSVAPAAPMADPSLGIEPSESELAEATEPARQTDAVKLRLTDHRVFPWLLCGVLGTSAQAVSGQVIPFLIIDRMGLPPIEAQQMIGLVLMSGAMAAVLAQWGLIPRLKMEPRAMILSGGVLVVIGMLGIAQAHQLLPLAFCFALSSLGFGLLRPGYTSGASLAVGSAEQAIVAGRVASTNGLAFLFGPSVGILFYGLWAPLPYYTAATAMTLTLLYAWRKLSVAAGTIQPAGTV